MNTGFSMSRFDIEQCDHCGTRVIAKPDGSCPACQGLIGTTDSPIKPQIVEMDQPVNGGVRTIASTPARSSAVPKVLIAFVVLAVLGIGVAGWISKYNANLNRKLLIFEIRKFGLLYHEFYAAHGRAPNGLAELKSFTPPLNSGELHRGERAFDAIRRGQIVIIWSAVFRDDGEENDKYLLGYESTAPEKGGITIRAGGSVREMTAEEFNAYPKIPTLADSSQ